MERSRVGGEAILLAVRSSSSSKNVDLLGWALAAEQAMTSGVEWHDGRWQ